jgi:iron complex outermembrane receptor protein
VEFRAQYDWDGWFDGHWAVGAEATYLIEYKRGAVNLKDTDLAIAPAEDRAGQGDLVNDFFSYPELKANAFAAFVKGPFSLRWQVRYSEGVTPAFGSPLFITVPNPAATTTGGRDLVPVGKSDDYWQHDIVVRWEAPWDSVVSLSVQNVFDKDPPYAPSQYNYDYTSGNPLGRVIEVGVKKTF